MKKLILFGCLFLIGLSIFLRFYKLDQIPFGYNRDEASIGYTAYSLLLTGKDEYGRFFPVSIESFGDWKLPLYPYLTIISVWLFSFSLFATRFISALSGSLSILFIFLLARKIFEGYDNEERLTWLSTVFFSWLPWNFYFSRIAYEANLALFLIIFATWAFLKGSKTRAFLIISAFVFGLTLFTYHTTHIFTPIYVIFLCILFYKNVSRKKDLGLFFIIFALFTGVAMNLTLFGADKTKISGIGIFSDRVSIYTNVDLPLSNVSPGDRSVARIYYNKYVYFARKIVVNYISFFLPDFLVLNGGINKQHNLPNKGNVDPVSYFLLLIGFISYFSLKKFSRKTFTPFLILLLCPISASITRDAPHYTRSVFGAAGIPLIIAFGVNFIFSKLGRMSYFTSMVTILFVILLHSFSIGHYYKNYFFGFPKTGEKIWNRELVDTAKWVNGNESKYSKIITTRPSYSPYIFYLFESKFNPHQFQLNAVHYPLTDEGFNHVLSFNKYYFVKSLDEVSLMPGVLYIDWEQNLIKNLNYRLESDKKRIKLVNTIVDSDGNPIIRMFEVV